MLSELVAAGKVLLVATSKPQVFADKILTHFGLDKYFTHICGVALQAPRGYSKADVIREALAKAGVTDLSTAVMVGDRMDTDIISGLESGMSTVLVLSGISTPETLKTFAYRPTLVLDGVGDIVRLANGG